MRERVEQRLLDVGHLRRTRVQQQQRVVVGCVDVVVPGDVVHGAEGLHVTGTHTSTSVVRCMRGTEAQERASGMDARAHIHVDEVQRVLRLLQLDAEQHLRREVDHCLADLHAFMPRSALLLLCTANPNQCHYM